MILLLSAHVCKFGNPLSGWGLRTSISSLGIDGVYELNTSYASISPRKLGLRALPSLLKVLFGLVMLAAMLTNFWGQSVSEPFYYFFLSDQRVVTLELVDDKEAILNYINIGSTFEIIQAPLLLVLDEEGNSYRGHLIQIEEPGDPTVPFQVSSLIKPGEYVGHTILGHYSFRSTPKRAFLKVGSRILEMDPVSSRDFELVASRIGELDLSRENGKQMVLEAGFYQGHGQLYPAGSKTALEMEPYFPDLELLAPILVIAPRPLLLSAFQDLLDPVVVRLSAVVSRSGGLRNVRVVEGINEKLNGQALDTVKNNWTFLPAISEGKVADTELTLQVVFRRE